LANLLPQLPHQIFDPFLLLALSAILCLASCLVSALSTILSLRASETHALVELGLVRVRAAQARFGTPAAKALKLAMVKTILARLPKAARTPLCQLGLGMHAVGHRVATEARPDAEGMVSTISHNLWETAFITASAQFLHCFCICRDTLPRKVAYVQVGILSRGPLSLSHLLDHFKGACLVTRLLHFSMTFCRG